jgi:integrase/recombinase XerD
MTHLENHFDRERAPGKPCPAVSQGEWAEGSDQLTPPRITSNNLQDLPNITPVGQREFLRRRRVLAKMEEELLVSELPGQAAVKEFILHLYRRNCRSNTLRSYFGTIQMFLTFLHRIGRTHLEVLSRKDLEAFLEHEQDRSLKPLTVKTRLSLVKAFIRFLVRRELVRSEVLERSIRIKVPELLPKAMEPEEVKQLLAVVKKVRDRAMILVLLRTGMRIGELLSTTVSDLNLNERKILIFQAEKTQVGRVVYLSDDAHQALLAWLAERDPHKQQLFYGQGQDGLSYTAARMMLHRYLDQAGLSRKGHSLHSLRHTFASELLNAGMRLECLQQLLGHTNLEVTRRYAKLTDKTREEEYFRAMALIEKGHVNGHYRRDHQLSAFSQEA